MLASVDLEGSAVRVAEAVTSWLKLVGNTRWLLIFDNYDNPKIPGLISLDVVDLSQYIPDCDHGCILVTTRSSRVDLGSRIHIQKLTKVEEGLSILSNTSGRVGLENGRICVIHCLQVVANHGQQTRRRSGLWMSWMAFRLRYLRLERIWSM